MGNHSVAYRSKEKSDSREWSVVMNAAKMSGRLGIFILKYPLDLEMKRFLVILVRAAVATTLELLEK